MLFIKIYMNNGTHVWNLIDLKVIGSTHGGCALWKNLLRVVKPKKKCRPTEIKS